MNFLQLIDSGLRPTCFENPKMLIGYDELQKYIGHLTITGAFHIGAHECEELEFYGRLGLKASDVYWIDALDEKVQLAKARGIPNIFQAVVTDKDDDIVTFNVTNNGQSSSIFEFGTHATYYDWCKVTEKKTLKTSRVDTLASKNHIPIDKLNFWNLDIQGAELLALKGAGNILKTVDVIYTEVNIEEVYKGCPHVNEIDAYLSLFGFARVATTMTRENWGDALYIRPPPKISLCIATMDRWSFLKETLPKYLTNVLIDEIVISDENGHDCEQIFKAFGPHPKIRLFSNMERLGAFSNKMAAVSHAKNKWVCVFDSDNYAPPTYFSAALNAIKDENVVYLPSRLLAYKSDKEFDNRQFIGSNIDNDFARKNYSDKFETLCQSGNFVCAKDFFMKATSIYGLENQCDGLDALYRTILFLKAGAVLRVIPGMEYYHAVHSDSITMKSLGVHFDLNKNLLMNILHGNNPWIMPLRFWNIIIKPLSQWLVNCSEFDKQNDDFVPFPIGMSWQISQLTGNLSSLVTNGSHNELVLCAIAPDTDTRRRGTEPVNRKRIIETLSRNGIINSSKNYIDFIQIIKDYKFIVSPEGNGVDCHRHYEALLCGSIPIVEENPMIALKYPNMPILYTKDYSEINSTYLESKWAEMLDKVYDFSPLFLSFYSDSVQRTIKANSDYWCMRTAGQTWAY